MSKMKIASYIIVLLALTSCFSMVDPKIQSKYIESKSEFDSSLTKHFPKILPNEYYGYSFSSGGSYSSRNCGYLQVNTRYKFKHRYNSKKNELISKSIFQANSSDTCTIKVLNEYISDTTGLSEKLKKLNHSCAFGYPIPSDIDYSYSISTIKFENNIYVIDSDSTSLLENKDWPNITYLPKGWEKGYSVGFALNDTYFIISYWLIIW